MAGVYSPTLSPWLAWTSYSLVHKGTIINYGKIVILGLSGLLWCSGRIWDLKSEDWWFEAQSCDCAIWMFVFLQTKLTYEETINR